MNKKKLTKIKIPKIFLLNKSSLVNFCFCIFISILFCSYYPNIPSYFIDSAYLISGIVEFDTTGNYLWSEAWISTHSIMNFFSYFLLKLNLSNFSINYVLIFLCTLNFVLGFFLLTKSISKNNLFSYFITIITIFFQINVDNLDYRSDYFNFNIMGVFGLSLFVLFAGTLFSKKYIAAGILSIFIIAGHTTIGLLVTINSLLTFFILYFFKNTICKNFVSGFLLGSIFLCIYLLSLKFFFYKINLSIPNYQIDWGLIKVWLVNWDWHRTKTIIEWEKILIFFSFILFLLLLNLNQFLKNDLKLFSSNLVLFIFLIIFILFFFTFVDDFKFLISFQDFRGYKRISINKIYFYFLIFFFFILFLILSNFNQLLKKDTGLLIGNLFILSCLLTSLVLFFLQRYLFVLKNYNDISIFEIFFHLPIPTRFINVTSVLVFPVFVSYIFRINNFRLTKYNFIFNFYKIKNLLNIRFVNIVLFFFITLVVINFEFIIKSRKNSYNIHNQMYLHYVLSENSDFWRYIKNLDTKGNFLVHDSNNNYLINKLGNKPNFIALGNLDIVNYVPNIISFIKNVIEEIYNIDFYNPPEACKRSGGLQCTKNIKESLEKKSVDEWNRISKKYNIQGVVLPEDWKVKLEPTYKKDKLTYYAFK